MAHPVTRRTAKNTIGYHHQSSHIGKARRPSKLKMAAAGDHCIVPTIATGPSARVCRNSVTIPTKAAARPTEKQTAANAIVIAADAEVQQRRVTGRETLRRTGT